MIRKYLPSGEGTYEGTFVHIYDIVSSKVRKYFQSTFVFSYESTRTVLSYSRKYSIFEERILSYVRVVVVVLPEVVVRCTFVLP